MKTKTFKTLMELFELETIEVLGDAKFAVEVVKIATEKPVVFSMPWDAP